MAYDYLRQRISDEGWIGKSILQITDTVHEVINAPMDWLYNSPPIQAIADSTPLGWIIEFLEENQGLAADCGLLFLETGYAVNRAYNSEQYEGQLTSKGNSLLNSLALTPRDENIYMAAISGNNSLFESQSALNDLSFTFSASGPNSPQGIMDSLKQQAIAKLNELISDLGEITEDTAASIKRKARDFKRFLKAAIAGVTGNVKSIPSLTLIPKFTGGLTLAPLTPAIPTVSGAVNVIGDIAMWLIEFLAKSYPMAGVPVEALAWTTTSMVTKYLGGIGATACRYLAGGVLRGASNALPTLVAPTGLFAGCWGALMAFAPLIILAAVLTITFLKNKQVLGEYLYVMGIDGQRFAYGNVKLFDTNREEMFNKLAEMRYKMLNEGFGSFGNLTGFAFDKKDKIVMCLDLTHAIPLPVYGEAAIADKFEPFRDLYEKGPLGI